MPTVVMTARALIPGVGMQCLILVLAWSMDPVNTAMCFHIVRLSQTILEVYMKRVND